ncbi:hypothetical protein PIB30_087918, partial [Stylosanthes scabra]|nr:hypothetical protein [Stylosanthes scabra]
RLHGSISPLLGWRTSGMSRGPVPQLPMTSHRGSSSVQTRYMGQSELVRLNRRPDAIKSHIQACSSQHQLSTRCH